MYDGMKTWDDIYKWKEYGWEHVFPDFTAFSQVKRNEEICPSLRSTLTKQRKYGVESMQWMGHASTPAKISVLPYFGMP